MKSTCFSDDGSHVITASEDKTVRIWRVSDGEHVGTLDTESAVRPFHSIFILKKNFFINVFFLFFFRFYLLPFIRVVYLPV